MSADLPELPPLIRRPGWPKTLPCLRCGRLREAATPSDRLHEACRRLVQEAADGLATLRGRVIQ